MRRALLPKELRQLSPVAALWLGLPLLDIPAYLFTSRLDELSWVELEPSVLGEGGLGGVYVCVMGLVIGLSLLAREHDEGTIHFLHSLPIGRSAVVFTKLLAGAMVVTGAVLLEHIISWALQAFNSQSLSGEQYRLGTALTLCSLQWVVGLCCLCHGLLWSFFRRFGLLVYGVLWLMVLSLQDHVELMERLNITRLATLHHDGAHVVFPFADVALHLGLAVLTLGCAVFLWTVPAEGFAVAYGRLVRRAFGRALLWAGALGAAGVAFALLGETLGDQEPEVDVSFAPAKVGRLQTRHYDFTYFQGLRADVLALARGADADYGWLSARLSSQAAEPIVVDLTEQGGDHLGVAGGHKIRMNMGRHGDLSELRRTLGHESVHVLARQASGPSLSQYGAALWLFHEGLAEYLALQLHPDPVRVATALDTAALAWQRHHLEPEVLYDRGAFLRSHLEPLVYALGVQWLAALVEVCGERAPAAILRASGDRELPIGLGGGELWQHLAQRSGCGRRQVEQALARSLRSRGEQLEQNPETPPRLSARLLRDAEGGLQLEVRARPTGRGGVDVSVYMRRDADVDPAAIHVAHDMIFPLVGAEPEEDAGAADVGSAELEPEPEILTFAVPDYLADRPFEYALGAQRNGVQHHETWRHARIPGGG